MPDSDLMFRPATELAEMVRAGEISALELVEGSLERIGELNPALNAFVEVDAERALEAARAHRPARSAAVRRRAGRDQEQPAREGPAAHLRLRADGRATSPSTTTTSAGACATPAS